MLINLAFLSQKPTGLSNYALNILPHLLPIHPLLLCPQFTPVSEDVFCHFTSPKLSSDAGLKGHLRRLFWTQFSLPNLYQKYQRRLLFSPIPEAPVNTTCRSVVMVHDCIPLRFSSRRSLLKVYFKYGIPQVLRQAEHLLCNSWSTAEDVQRFFKIPEHRITVIPLAHNAARFYPQKLPRQNYFLYVGRSDPHKNLQRVLEAFLLISQKTDGALWIGGSFDARYTPQLQAWVQEKNLKDRVKFLGYVPESELPQLLNQALALVFPSLWEGFGLPVLEAMACGTPVITSNQSALPEVAGDAALLVDPFSVPEIAAAMDAMVNQSGLWQTLSDRSIVQAERFSWQWTGEKTLATLKQFL
jgi:glycosyltransferase involved in cell wall biosynthesis